MSRFLTKVSSIQIHKLRISRQVLVIAALCVSGIPASAASFTTSVFATGSAVSGTAPDSVTYGNGSLWVEYGNGASSTDYTGASTIAQYSLSGSVQNTYSIKGSVDGLKYDPNTGLVWALQNQDANSKLSVINPATKVISSYTYGAPYTSVASSRGFDDVAFIGSNVYLSESNPSSPGDPIVVKLNNPTPSSPITVSTVLTGTGILGADPDSLKSTPSGGLVLTSGNESALTFITNPGLATQSAHSVKLSGAAGSKLSLDDSIYATSTAGTFYVADTKTNTVYAISATGLIPGSSLFADVGYAFGSANPGTGAFTSISSGSGLHGIAFVPSATATPEPSTLAISVLGAGLVLIAIHRRRLAKK